MSCSKLYVVATHSSLTSNPVAQESDIATLDVEACSPGILGKILVSLEPLHVIAVLQVVLISFPRCLTVPHECPLNK